MISQVWHFLEPLSKLPNREIFWDFEVTVSGWCLRVEEAMLIGIRICSEHRNISLWTQKGLGTQISCLLEPENLTKNGGPHVL